MLQYELFGDDSIPVSSTYTTTEVGNHIGITARKLNKFLEDRGVILKFGGEWKLANRYIGLGLVVGVTREHSNKRFPGQKVTSHQLYWTDAGKDLISEMWEEQEEIEQALDEYRD
jgi:phage antirepressor YoqD-like protein